MSTSNLTVKKAIVVYQHLITGSMNEKNNATLYVAFKFWSSLTGITQKAK
jgi:hypothetical protein